MKTALALAAELGSAAGPADDEVASQLGNIFQRWHAKQKP